MAPSRWARIAATLVLGGALGLGACATNATGYDAGTGPHSCADCAQAAACCQAVQASEGNGTPTCASSETVCQSLSLDLQREYIFDCDSYLLNAPHDASACP